MTIELGGLTGQLVLLVPWLLLAIAAFAYVSADWAARARPETVPAHREPPSLSDLDAAPIPRSATVDDRAQPVSPVTPSPATRPATEVAARSAPAPRSPPLSEAPAAPRPPLAHPTPASPAPMRPAQKPIPVTAAAAVPALPELARPPFPKAPPAAEAVAKALALAETAGDDDKRAELMVALGEARFREGAPASQAADIVRNGLLLAVQRGAKETHAKGRIALGDLAQAGGDLTTACEHWQLARDLYRELKLDDALRDAEARMRRNGCPTDWVLNDF